MGSLPMFLCLTWTPIFSVFILFRPPRVCYIYKLIFTVEVIFYLFIVLFNFCQFPMVQALVVASESWWRPPFCLSNIGFPKVVGDYVLS